MTEVYITFGVYRVIRCRGWWHRGWWSGF